MINHRFECSRLSSDIQNTGFERVVHVFVAVCASS